MTDRRETRPRLGRRGLWLLALLAAGCSTSPGETPPPPPSDGGPDAGPLAPEWRVVLDELDETLLSVWGTSANDVWAVGGPLGNSGFESLVLRFDGTKWKRARPGRAESYWWVHGTGPNDVWLVGEKGRITHWDGASFREDTSGTTATLFGVWAAAPDDAWAVGGIPEDAAAAKDVLLHWDGTSWKPETLPEALKVTFFKVWGANKDDLYVVGENAVVWHKKAGAWKREAEGLGTGRLTTVAGCGPNEVYAVGGRDFLASNGSEWKRVDVPLVNDVNGVACAGGKAVVVGGGTLKLRLEGGQWISDFSKPPLKDLHGAWVDPSGALWGVGGQFSASAKPGARRSGVVARYGEGAVPATLEP